MVDSPQPRQGEPPVQAHCCARVQCGGVVSSCGYIAGVRVRKGEALFDVCERHARPLLAAGFLDEVYNPTEPER